MSTKTQQIREEHIVTGKAELPEGWSMASLKQVASHLVDGSHNPPAKQASGVPMLSARNVEDGRIVLRGYRFIAKRDFEAEDARTKVRAGDVLLTIVGSIGRAAVVPDGMPLFALQRSVAVIKPIIDSHYVMYALRSPDSREFFEEAGAGTAQQGVYLGTLSSMPIQIAPAAEQTRIVAEIETVIPKIDRAVEKLSHVSAIIQHFRQAVLAAACSGKLTEDWRVHHSDIEPAAELLSKLRSESRTNKLRPSRKSAADQLELEPFELPVTWQWAAVAEVCLSVADGDHQAPPKSRAGIAFAVISNISSGQLDLSETMFVPSSYYDGLSPERKPRRGDLLYSVTGSYGIAVAVETDEDFCFQRHIALLRGHPLFDSRYLYRVMSSQLAYDQATSVATGIAQLTVPLSGLRALRIPVPPIDEQNEIVRRVEALFKLADAIENRVAAATTRAERLTQAVLAKAFRGELVPTEAELARREGREYEPASVLLDRIKVEREKISASSGDHRSKRRKSARA